MPVLSECWGGGGGGQRRGVGVCNSYSQTFWRGITVMPVLSECWGGGGGTEEGGGGL